jgi:protocatechuate 3,4-dioxygenase beta subunit
MNAYASYYQKLTRWQLLFSKKNIWFIVFLFILSSFEGTAKEVRIDKNKEPITSFDELFITIYLKTNISIEVEVLISDSDVLYINIADLFSKLEIPCAAGNKENSLQGFIENENNPYFIDFDKKQIKIGKRTINAEQGLINEMGDIYIKSSLLEDAFGLTITFNQRSLSAKLTSNFELAFLKKMRVENSRQNILKLQEKLTVVDTIIKREYHLFKPGMLDWGISLNQTNNEYKNNFFRLGVGAELLYGEANVTVNYSNLYEFNNRMLQYSWRWIDNDTKYIKQAQLGDIFPRSISFLSAPVVGGSINNSPNTVRKSSGFYTISEHTEPNWTVELYINDVLIDYTLTDASGLYVFRVPIVYGYTILKLKFYGPLGEERIEERTTNVPFTFVPAKTLEYSVSGGVLEDKDNSKFGQGVANYGINRFMTIGAGLEYLSSIPDKPLIPFASFAVQPFSTLGMSFEYAHNVRMRSLLSYNFGKSAFLEIDYANYVDGQKATPFNANEERKIRVSVPFKMKKVSGFAKLNFNQFVYSSFDYNQFDAIFSAYYKNYSANISTLLNWVGDRPTYMTSIASLSYRMRNGLILRPSAEYNVSDNQLLWYRAEIERSVNKMYLSVSYERKVLAKTDNVSLNFRYDLNFARVGFSTFHNNLRTTFSENAQGSLAFGADNGVVKSSNNSALGKGGILFYPFLDLNQNGKLDKGEQRILLTNVRVTAAKAVISEKDSIVRVSDLNAFINYTVEFSDDDLDNISWRFKHKTYQVLVDPNQYKKVDVPIISIGEVSGIVSKNNEGIGRITIQIYDKKGNKVAETLTETDGYYSYLGLKPGEYSTKIDEAQLNKLGYESTPKTHSAVIKASVDGDVIQGLDFNLTNGKDSVAQVESKIIIPTENPVKVNPEKSDVNKSSTEISGVEKIHQNNVVSGNGKLDILNRYSQEKNGKIYGQVHTKAANTIVGISGLSMQLYNKDGQKASEVITNDQGNYNFSDLIPGEYSISIDEAQLKNLKYQVLPKTHNVDIIISVDGDIIENLDFEIYTSDKIIKDSVDQKVYKNTISTENPTKNSVEKRDVNKSSDKVSNEKAEMEAAINKSFSKISDTKGSFYSVQLGVFKKIVTPKQLLNLTPVYYEILPDRTARYISGKYDLLKTAKNARNIIIAKGIRDAYVVAYQNGEKIERTKLDSLKKYSKVMKGKIYGQVHTKDANATLGISGILVQLYDVKGVKVSEVTTRDKGVFSFSGIEKGEYIVRLDNAQLEKLGYESTPKTHSAVIKASVDGDIIQGLDFNLTNGKDLK